MMTRRTLQKLIHVGCRELGLDQDTRHELQLVATGKVSQRDMSEADLRAVIDALKARGFRPEGRRHPKAPRADLRLIHVLWRKLGDAGVLERPGRDGLNAFIRARFGASWGNVPIDVDALRDANRINAVIRALRDWCARAGVEP